MTTSAADHAKALRLIQETGHTLDQANAVMAKLYAAGIHLVSIDPPVEPQTGPKAEKPHERVEELRRIVASVTKPTEYAQEDQ